MLYRKTFQGAHEFSAMVVRIGLSFMFTKQYMGYTKAEAKAMFMEDLAKQQV